MTTLILSQDRLLESFMAWNPNLKSYYIIYGVGSQTYVSPCILNMIINDE